MKTKEMVYYSIMNLGILTIGGFSLNYLYFFLQEELHFTLNQDFFRYFLIFLGLVIGIIFAPLFGHLSDRTKSKMGRRRPWILIFSPLTALLFWLISVPFFRQSFIESGSIFIYIIIISIFYSISINATNIPYIGLMADITPEKQRLKMSSFFNIVGGIGTGANLVLPALLLLIIDSYIFVCGMLSLILIMTSLITFFKIKEISPKPESSNNLEKESYFEVLKDKRFITYELAQFFWNFSFMIILSSLIAFSVTVFEISNEFEFGLTGVLLLLIIGAFFVIWNLKGVKWGKKKSLLFSLFWLAAVFPFTLLFSLTPPSSILLELPGIINFTIKLPSAAVTSIQIQGIIWMVFLGVGIAGILIFPYSILMGIVKKEKEATYIGFNSTFLNLSGALGTLVMGLLTFYLGPRGAFYVIGPIMGIFFLISGLIIRKLKEN